MKTSILTLHTCLVGTLHAVAISALMAGDAHAGTFLTATIDGDFSEWAGLTVLDSDPADNTGGVDIGNIKVANDDNYLYIHYTHHTSSALSTFVAIDVDSTVSTGFDIFGLGLVGAEAQWQNDFPFTSSTGVFNNGFGMSGDYFGSGAALIAPFGDATEHELAISLNILFNETSAPVFANNTFTILLWTDSAAGDVSSPITYTLAVPEPRALLLGVAGFAACVGRRRR
ncbi:MAG: hypothetical protein KDN05_02485 [Verrucomicrobiae bacterium]|nr:hypothetical protein [Verrucomicrobiae bacterium]